MLAKFNPTGTHVKNGFLKVRIDLFPEVGDKTYALHDVEVSVIPPEGYQGEVDGMGRPVDQADYDNWIDGLPKIQQLNPALCHFIKIDKNTTLASLDAIIKEVFDTDTKAKLDEVLSGSDAMPVGQVMKSKLGNGKAVSKFTDKDRDELNARLASLEVSL